MISGYVCPYGGVVSVDQDGCAMISLGTVQQEYPLWWNVGHSCMTVESDSVAGEVIRAPVKLSVHVSYSEQTKEQSECAVFLLLQGISQTLVI